MRSAPSPRLSLILVPVTSKERSNLRTGSEYLVTPTSAAGWDWCWVTLLCCCWGISDTLRHQPLKILATTAMMVWCTINCKGLGDWAVAYFGELLQQSLGSVTESHGTSYTSVSKPMYVCSLRKWSVEVSVRGGSFRLHLILFSCVRISEDNLL